GATALRERKDGARSRLRIQDRGLHHDQAEESVRPSTETRIVRSLRASSGSTTSARWASRTALASQSRQRSHTWCPMAFFIRRRLNSRSVLTTTASCSDAQTVSASSVAAANPTWL